MSESLIGPGNTGKPKPRVLAGCPIDDFVRGVTPVTLLCGSEHPGATRNQVVRARSKRSRSFVALDLHRLSFDALVLESGRFLVEDGPTLHYLSSERNLVPQSYGELPVEGVLALGGPDYDMAQGASRRRHQSSGSGGGGGEEGGSHDTRRGADEFR